MIERVATRSVRISHPGGLHARPSLAVAQTARRFHSHITIAKGADVADAGQVLQLLTLGAACGAELTISAEGDDAEAALDALVELFDENFGIDDDE